MRRYGIDISAWQRNFDIEKARQDYGVEFVIIKAGGGDAGLYTDKYFKRNYSLCEQLGMPKGCYFFSKAMTMDVAKKEVEYFLNIIKGKKFDYPIFMDYEDKILTLSKRALTNIAKYQLKALQDAGYWVGIYTSESHFNDHFIDEELKGYSHWVANYAAEEPPKLKYSATQMWQCCGSRSAAVNPIMLGEPIDQNYCYIDYPERIKAKGLNGYVKAVPTTPPAETSGKYKVQCGAFLVKSRADKLKELLELNRFNSTVVKSGLLYKVQCGPYATKQEADTAGKRAVALRIVGSYIVVS